MVNLLGSVWIYRLAGAFFAMAAFVGGGALVAGSRTIGAVALAASAASLAVYIHLAYRRVLGAINLRTRRIRSEGAALAAVASDRSAALSDEVRSFRLASERWMELIAEEVRSFDERASSVVAGQSGAFETRLASSLGDLVSLKVGDLMREVASVESHVIATIGELISLSTSDTKRLIQDRINGAVSRDLQELHHALEGVSAELKSAVGALEMRIRDHEAAVRSDVRITHEHLSAATDCQDRTNRILEEVHSRLSQSSIEGLLGELRSELVEVHSALEVHVSTYGEGAASTLAGLRSLEAAMGGLLTRLDFESGRQELSSLGERLIGEHQRILEELATLTAVAEQGAKGLDMSREWLSEALSRSALVSEQLDVAATGFTTEMQKLHNTIEAEARLARDRFAVVQSKFQGVRTSLEQLPQSAGEYQVLRGRLIDDDVEPPPVGGWALSSPTMVAITRRILTDESDPTVLELGSGASTVWIALALQARGAGHCITIEHLPEYAAETRKQLAKRGLSAWVSVIHAPLRGVELEGRRFDWYDRARIPQDVEIDILLVDGPPGDTGLMARYPALPLLAHALRDGSWVVLDDTIRTDEKRVLEAWGSCELGGSAVVEPRSTGKSTILTFRRDADALV